MNTDADIVRRKLLGLYYCPRGRGESRKELRPPPSFPDDKNPYPLVCTNCWDELFVDISISSPGGIVKDLFEIETALKGKPMINEDANEVKRKLLGLEICPHCKEEKPKEEVLTKAKGLPQPCDLCVLHHPVINDRCMKPNWDPR